MVVKVYIKRRAYGMVYAFTIKNINLSDKTATLWLWNDRTLLISGGVCTISYSGSTGNTTVRYTVLNGDFPTVEDYDSEIRFSGPDYREKSETFLWVVEESAPTTSTSTSTTLPP